MTSLLVGSRSLRKEILRISCRFTPLTSRRRYVLTNSVKQRTATASATLDGHQTTSYKSVDEIPGPKRFPLLGSFLSMAIDKDFKRPQLHKYWKKLHDIYGDILRVDFPGVGPMVLIFRPEECQHLAKVTLKYPVRIGGDTLRKVRLENVDNYFENKAGLLPSNHEEWWRVRSRVQTPMTKPKNVTAYLEQMDRVSLDFMDKIADFQKELGEMPKDFQMELFKWALESVSVVALNRRLGCLDPNLPKDSEPMIMIKGTNSIFEALNVTELGPQLWRFFPTPSYLKVKNSHNTFLKIADAHIRKTEEILMAKDPESKEDLTLMETLLMTPGLSRKDVVTLIMDMMFAGIDTTAYTTGFTLYLLARNPRVQKKLQGEIDSVLADHQGLLKPQHLAKLSYLKMVVKESLRIFPQAPGVFRTLEEDTVFCGYVVPKGFHIACWTSLMSQDERFFDKPMEFIPERWARDRPHGDFHPYTTLPFGVGTRMCIGRRIAEQEIYTFLIRALQRFDVGYKYQDMGIITRMVQVPSEPLRFNFCDRR